MSTYKVEVTREGEDWLAEVPALPGAHTFARNLESLDGYVREVIVLAADLPDDAAGSLDLDWRFRTGDGALDEQLAALRRDRQRLSEERRRVEEATAALAGRLGRAGFSVRDVAALTGVSRARAQQLASCRLLRRRRESRGR